MIRLLGCSRRLPDFALGIILQKPFPARTALCRGSLAASAESFEPIFAEGAVQWVRTHEMVAQGDGHTVRSVQSPGRTFDREHAADESRDLLLGGRASARDTLFDACGGVFEYLQSAAQRRSHRHALRPAQLEHRLHVLAEEGRFEGHLAGAVFVHEGTDPLENVAQLFVRIVHPVQVDVAQHDRSDLPSANLQHPVPHVVGAGVDAHDAVCRRVGHGAGTLLLLEGRDLLFRLTHAACQVGQVLEDGRCAVILHAGQRRIAETYFSVRYVFVETAFGADADPVADGHVVRDADLSREETVVPHLRSACDACLGRGNGILADLHVVADLDQVVEFHAPADDRRVGLGPVDAGVGADFHVVFDDDVAQLRNLVEAACGIGNEAEAVGADHRTPRKS